MFGNAPKGSKFYNTSSTDLEREIEKLKERLACCTENTPIIESTDGGTFAMPTNWGDAYIRLLGGAGAGNRIIVPQDSTYNYPIGTEITLFWDEATLGTGWSLRPEVAGPPAVPTLNYYSPSGAAIAAIAADKSAITLKKVGSNEWDVIGNIA